MTNEESGLVESFLKSHYVRDGGVNELSCGCMDLKIINGKNRYHFRSVDDTHNEHCELLSRSYDKRDRQPRKPPADVIFDLMQGEGEQKPLPSRQLTNKDSQGSGKRREHKVIATLYRILHLANTHKLNNKSRSFHETVAAIMQAAQQLRIPAALNMGDILHVGDIDFKNLSHSLQNVPSGWPQNSVWHHIQLTPCDSYKIVDRKIILSKKSKDGKDPIQTTVFKPADVYVRKPGNLSAKKSGPFLFILVFKGKKRLDGTYSLELAHAGVIYINKKSDFCPLESEHERGMLWALGKVLPERFSEWEIAKPIYDDDEGIRPDFVISGPTGKKLAIEVAGIDSEEYRLSKANTQPKMKKKYDYFKEYDATDSHAPFKNSLLWLRELEELKLL